MLLLACVLSSACLAQRFLTVVHEDVEGFAEFTLGCGEEVGASLVGGNVSHRRSQSGAVKLSFECGQGSCGTGAGEDGAVEG